jgi:osmotically-inducible protein OsmY
MKPAISHLVAALLSAGAVSFACAQAPQALQFADEPVASVSTADGPGGELATTIVKELIADPSLKGTKMTVQPENDTITLTGTTATRAQVKRAVEIATALAGEGKVINAILPDEA